MTARKGTRQIARSITTELNSADITHEIVKQAFGDVLRSLRLRVRMSQETFAKKTQIDRCTVSRLERGRSEPTLGFLFRMSLGLKVSPAIILARTEQRVGAMRDPEFDRSTAPLNFKRADIRNSHLLDDAPDIPTVSQAVAMVVCALRERAICSHSEYARRANIHPSYERQIEDGEINPTLTTLLLLSAAVGLPVGSLIGAVELLIQADLKKAVLNLWLRQLPKNDRDLSTGRPMSTEAS
jgi:transcriptional regulator with XRE-family HTH domain